MSYGNDRMKKGLDVIAVELERFRQRLDDLRACVEKDGDAGSMGCRHSAAFNRASLDLSQIMADWRQGRIR